MSNAEKAQVKLSTSQLEKLLSWLKANDVKPDQQIKILETATGIGPHVRAELEITEDEGRYIDLTDYASW
jgi:hypothetical protein